MIRSKIIVFCWGFFFLEPQHLFTRFLDTLKIKRLCLCIKKVHLHLIQIQYIFCQYVQLVMKIPQKSPYSTTKSTVLHPFLIEAWRKRQKANCDVKSCQPKPASPSNSLTPGVSAHSFLPSVPFRLFTYLCPDMRIPLLSNVTRISERWTLTVSFGEKWKGTLERNVYPCLAVTFHQMLISASHPWTEWIFIRWL